MDIIQPLLDLGLHAKEAKLYFSILSLGQATANEAAKHASIPRTTAYPFLESLVSRGLILQEVDSKGGSKFTPRSLEVFSQLLESEKSELKRKENSIRHLVQFLIPYFGQRRAYIPKLRFVEGKKAVDKLLHTSIHDWRKSYERYGDWTMWGYQDHTFVDEYREWHEYAWKIRNPKERICLFSTKEGLSQQTKDRIKLREIRKLPGGYEFPCSIWIHADHVLLGMTATRPHFAILLVDVVIAETLRTLFKMLWELSAKRD